MLARVTISLMDAQWWPGKNGLVKGSSPSFLGAGALLLTCLHSPIWLTPPLGNNSFGLVASMDPCWSILVTVVF